MKMVSGRIRIDSPHQEYWTEILMRKFDDSWEQTYYREEATTIRNKDYIVLTDDHYRLFIKDLKDESIVGCTRGGFLECVKGRFRKGISSKDIPGIIKELEERDYLMDKEDIEEIWG